MSIVQIRTMMCFGAALAAFATPTRLFGQPDDETPKASQSLPSDTKAEANSMVQLLTRTMGSTKPRRPAARYRLQPGDVVEIDFALAPAFNQLQSVQPDGYMAVQKVGELYAEGKTVPELTEALAQKYSAILRDPIITVVLKEFERPYFVASGNVSKPGKYELRGLTTVTQAIAMAGGFSDVAKRSRVLLFRRVSNDYVNIKQLDLKKMFGRGNLHEDVELQPGDLLFVPRSVTASVIKALLPHTAAGLYIPIRD